MTKETETLQRLFDEIAEREGAPQLVFDEDGAAAAKSALEVGLHNLRVDGGPAAERAELLASALERSLALVDGKIEEARATSAANPLTYKALGDFAALHVDAASDALATLVALGRPIPEPERDLDPDEKLLYRNILLGSGNHELQKYNAGIAGYMLENAPELPKRIGDNLAYRVFIGGSRLASK